MIQAHGGEALKHAVFSSGGAPLIYRRIGGAHPSLGSPLRRRLHEALMRRADRVVTVADAVRDETLAMFRLTPERVITIPNGVDPARMHTHQTRDVVRATLGISPGQPVILSAGAITWEKDPSAHLEISRRVSQKRPDVVHLMAGDGPLRNQSEEMVKRWGAQDRILFLGVRGDMAEIMAAADVLLFASRPDGMEGMPAVLIEAGMCGVPVAGFDVAGAREIVIDAETGRLVAWSDMEGLANAVLQVLDRPDMGLAARTHCLERFSIDRIAKQYLDVYEEVLSR